jgi:hypothetical protein
MLRRATISVVLALGIGVPSQSPAADERPRSGLLYNTQETHSLTYDCADVGEQLDCQFTQVAVRRKVNSEDITAHIEKSRKDFSELSDKSKVFGDCGDYSSIISAIKEGRPPTNADVVKFKKAFSDPVQRYDAIEMFTLIDAYCKKNTEENYMKFIRHMVGRDSRTCLVSVNPYKSTFKRVYGSAGYNYIAVSSPTGPCGIIDVSRFEQENATALKITLWKYYSRRAVANPNSEILPGASCSKLDQQEYLYDWRSTVNVMKCDYIEFSAL